MGVDKIENIIYPKNVHLYASVFTFFPLENIYLCACTQKWCFLHLKCLLLKEYTPLCKFSSIKNIHLFEVTKMVLSTRRIYTSVQVFFYFFTEEYLPLIESIKWCFLHLKCPSLEKY